MVDPALALSVFFALATVAAVAFWPRRGLFARLSRGARLDERVHLEDALKHAFMCERQGESCTLESLAGRLNISRGEAARLLSRLAGLGLVRSDISGVGLTEEGARSALRIVRTHRLWERYLADRTGVPAGEWHDHAERMEHTLSDDDVAKLESRLGHPRWDPHGDPIPTAAGEIPPVRGMGLLGAEVGRTVEIVHLEDEPREIYDALLADGLAPGGRAEVLESDGGSVTLRVGGRTLSLNPVVARNVTVRHLPDGEAAPSGGRTLADIPIGKTVRVRSISASCQGTQRRRLLDLGVVRGTDVTPELRSAAGDPIAYRVRGALVALRSDQAAWIEVEPIAGEREVA
jgi:DtxR family Mn-dependent transcriptional regulator